MSPTHTTRTTQQHCHTTLPTGNGSVSGSGNEIVRGALLTKGPDSSFDEVHRGSCSGNIHMEEKVKDQEDEVEDGRDK